MARARYDLEGRLLAFAVQVCRPADSFPRTTVGRHAGGQIARSSTSPAANYSEAQAAESRRDFVHKLRICVKELRETRVWLMLVRRVDLVSGTVLDQTAGECDELIAILSASIRTATRTLKAQRSRPSRHPEP
jgi:four helix bundle protein